MSDDPDEAVPAPPPTTHPDDRELGFGAVDARSDLGDSEAGPGAIPDPASPAPASPDTTSPLTTREASRDRAS